MDPDSNPLETARRALKIAKLVPVFREHKFSSVDVAMLIPDTAENTAIWKDLSQALHINPPSKKTRLMLVQALREAEKQS